MQIYGFYTKFKFDLIYSHRILITDLFIYICVIINNRVSLRMRDYKKIRIFGLFLFLLLMSVAIPLLVIGQINYSENSDQDIVYGTGEIVYNPLEGGFFGIKADDGNNYDPLNLPSEFEVEGLKVEFIGEILHDWYSIHMWGQIIRIIFIQKL